MKSRKRIEIYDTTLRDGVQGAGVSFTPSGKLLYARKLDEFGIDYIEGGYPGSNPKDMDFFTEMAKKPMKHAKLAAFGSTRRVGVKVKDDLMVESLIKANTPVVTIFGKAWKLHVKTFSEQMSARILT